jgi:hypothetical protein
VNQEKQRQSQKNNNMDPLDCRKSEEDYNTNTATATVNGIASRLKRQCRASIDGEATAATAVSGPKKKKKRTNSDSTSAAKNYNTIKQKAEEPIQEREHHTNNVDYNENIDKIFNEEEPLDSHHYRRVEC